MRMKALLLALISLFFAQPASAQYYEEYARLTESSTPYPAVADVHQAMAVMAVMRTIPLTLVRADEFIQSAGSVTSKIKTPLYGIPPLPEGGDELLHELDEQLKFLGTFKTTQKCSCHHDLVEVIVQLLISARDDIASANEELMRITGKRRSL